MSELDDVVNSHTTFIIKPSGYCKQIPTKAELELSALRSEIERLKAEREWQPMSTAPKNRTRILLLIRVFGGYKITIGWRSNNDIQWETEDGVYAHAQTFENMLEGWQSIPQQPEEE